MENYQDAFLHRLIDTETLHNSGRKIAAIHFGGITIECFLKAILLSSIPVGAKPEWKTDSYNPGHTISNPGHSFIRALQRNNKLYSRAQNSRHVMKLLEEVENPGQHFIDMRYSCDEPADADYKQWFENYSRLLAWIQRQSSQL